jgi:histone deacetylase complex regulatory component SIN3
MTSNSRCLKIKCGTCSGARYGVSTHVLKSGVFIFCEQEAYEIFAIDKLIGAIINQVSASIVVFSIIYLQAKIKVQVVLGDPKSLELELLKKERTHGTLTTQDQINSRQNAERILGPDGNLFRIDWVRVFSSDMSVDDIDRVSSCLAARP